MCRLRCARARACECLCPRADAGPQPPSARPPADAFRRARASVADSVQRRLSSAQRAAFAANRASLLLRSGCGEEAAAATGALRALSFAPPERAAVLEAAVAARGAGGVRVAAAALRAGARSAEPVATLTAAQMLADSGGRGARGGVGVGGGCVRTLSRARDAAAAAPRRGLC